MGDGLADERLRLNVLPFDRGVTVYLFNNIFIFSSICESFLAFSAASKICCANGDEFCFIGDVFVDLIIRRPFWSYWQREPRVSALRWKVLPCDKFVALPLRERGASGWNDSAPMDGRRFGVAIRPFHVPASEPFGVAVCFGDVDGSTVCDGDVLRTDRYTGDLRAPSGRPELLALSLESVLSTLLRRAIGERGILLSDFFAMVKSSL